MSVRILKKLLKIQSLPIPLNTHRVTRMTHSLCRLGHRLLGQWYFWLLLHSFLTCSSMVGLTTWMEGKTCWELCTSISLYQHIINHCSMKLGWKIIWHACWTFEDAPDIWCYTEKEVEPKQLYHWSLFMVRNPAPPVALFWHHFLWWSCFPQYQVLHPPKWQCFPNCSKGAFSSICLLRKPQRISFFPKTMVWF